MPSADYAGLFGNVAGGTLKNVRINSGNVTGLEYGGGVAGKISGSISITACYWSRLSA